MITATSIPTAFTTVYHGLPLGTWIAVGVAVVLLLILLVMLVLGASRRRAWDRSFDVRTADAAWVCDSLALAVADRTRSSEEVRALWIDGTGRTNTLSQQLYQLSATAPTTRRAAEARTLAARIDALRGSLDADVRLRIHGTAPGQDQVVAESAEVIGRRRRDVGLALAAR